MKNLIYQVWAGELRPGCNYSQKLFKKYAKNINADYRLDIDPNIASKICDVPMYFEWLNPILDDSFLEFFFLGRGWLSRSMTSIKDALLPITTDQLP